MSALEGLYQGKRSRKMLLLAAGLVFVAAVLSGAIYFAFAQTGDTTLAFFVAAVLFGVSCGLAPILVVSGIVLPIAPRGRWWKQTLSLYRALPRSSAPSMLDKLPKEKLLVAAQLPDNSPSMRILAAEALERRGVPLDLPEVVVPTFQVPMPEDRTRRLLRSPIDHLRRWGFPTALIIVGIEQALEAVQASWAIPDVVLQILQNLAVVVLLGWSMVCTQRRYPARVLFLRKFNRVDFGRSYRRLAQRELRHYGHLIGLGDRYMRRGWTNYFLGPLFDTNLILTRILVFPFVLVLRLFDKIRFGPPYVSSARDFRALCRHLDRRRWMNWQAQFAGLGFIVSTDDDWWQMTIRMMMRSSDVIVLDGSEVTSGTQWEIDTIDQLRLWDRVVLVTRAEFAETMDHFASSRTRMPDVWRYDARGRMEDAAGFRAAMAGTIHATTIARWATSEREGAASAEPVPSSKRKTMVLAAAGIVLLMLTAAGNHAYQKQFVPHPPWDEWIVETPEKGYRMGNPAARVHLVEYLSFSCEHCARLRRDESASMLERVRQGAVTWEIREVISDYETAVLGKLARCRDGKFFFSATDDLAQNTDWIGRLPDLSDMPAGQVLTDNDLQLAIMERLKLDHRFAKLGLPSDRFEGCMHRWDEYPIEVMSVAEKDKIDHTPFVFVNGKPYPEVTTWPVLRQVLVQ